MVFLYIGAALLILLLMITIHELGHYLAAKWTGIRVTEFAIGFGPAIFKWQSKKTGEIFSIRWIPLGGFCAFEGEDSAGSGGTRRTESGDWVSRKIDNGAHDTSLSSLVDAERAKHSAEFPLAKGVPYDRAHPWRRLVVLFSGALFNFIGAILFSIILLLVVGYNQGVRVEGFLQHNDTNNTFHTVTNESTASDTHPFLYKGDVILAFNDTEFTLLNGFNSVLAELDRTGETQNYMTVRRAADGTVETIPIVFGRVINAQGELTTTYALGIYMNDAEMVFMPMNFFAAIGQAFLFAFELAGLILNFLWMLISGQIGLSGIGGPVSTITVMAESVGASFLNILILVPLISVNLAVFNLLPFPALDGARMIFTGVEWVRGKPVNPEIEGRIHMVGLLLLMGLVLIADVNFLFGGGRSMLELFGQWRL